MFQSPALVLCSLQREGKEESMLGLETLAVSFATEDGPAAEKPFARVPAAIAMSIDAADGSRRLADWSHSVRVVRGHGGGVRVGARVRPRAG